MFTEEDTRPDGAMTILDTIITPTLENIFHSNEQEATYTDQYLQWDSHHHIAAKYIVINTLTHRANTFHSTP